MNGLVRVGTVSSVDYEKGSARVLWEERDDTVSAEFPLFAFEYDMPAVGDTVITLHLSSGTARGFVLGKYWSEQNPPTESGENIWRKELGPEAFLRYDRAEKTLTLCAEKIVITGDLTVAGNISVAGELTVTGDATVGGKSYLGHKHSLPGVGVTEAPL